MNIYLIGMMGCGKSSVGKLLSKYLKNTFYDLDGGIEKRFNLSIAEIFDQYGSEKFRSAERELLVESLSRSNQVIATGGGIILAPENREILGDNRVYFLNGSPELLYERATVLRDKRPLLKDMDLEEFIELFNVRDQLYNECASKKVNIDGKNIETVVEEIMNHEKFSF